LNNKRFTRRLSRLLPEWVELGWIAPEVEQAILAHAAQAGYGARLFNLSVTGFGILLVVIGAFSVIAANWEVIPRAARLFGLVALLAAAYSLAVRLLDRGDSPRLAQLALLGAIIIFGIDLFLVARMYRVVEHYPHLFMLWSLGALLAAYAAHSQPALILAVLIGTVWTAAESLEYARGVHWWFLPFVAAVLWRVCRGGKRAAFHAAAVALLAWSLFSLEPIDRAWPGASRLYLMQFYFLAYCGLFLAGLVMSTYECTLGYSRAVRRYGALAAVATFFALTFPDVHAAGTWLGASMQHIAATGEWIAATLIAVVVVLAFAAWYWQRRPLEPMPGYQRWGQGLLAGVVVFLIINLFPIGDLRGLIPAAYNVLFFTGLAWLIFAGMRTNDRFAVNTAFAFFTIGLFTRYFDTFWPFVHRAYLLMAGGVVLVMAGFVMENQRRKLTAEIAARRDEGGA
jgi:uncharacterized membrane protein